MERREALKLSTALLGYGLSGVVFSSMLQGCKVDNSEHWNPVFFSKSQINTIASISEHILPKTETPGAKDVLVHRFIDKLIAECYDKDAQQKFLSGLQEFETYCKEHSNDTFEDCSVEEKDVILAAMEELPYAPAMYLWGNKIKGGGDVSFYHQVKGLTLIGYFSSEEVGKNVLNYDPIPGKFVGCITISENENAWTL